jgi:6-pyruvoyltetrahydropterin/6-carboxytetrahydropterin synthase
VAKVTVQGDIIQTDGAKTGMLLDYGDLKAAVQPIVDSKLDHWDLNETLPVYPTSENIARWLYWEVLRELRDRASSNIFLRLVSVEINETCTSACTYYGAEVV